MSAVSAIRSNARVPAHADVKDAAGGIGRNDLPPAQGRPPAIVIEMRPPAARAPKFEDAVLPHLDAAYNLARWLVRDPAEAEDIVQDACLRALRFFTSFHGDSGKSWLLRIIRNTAYTRLRTNGKRGELAAGLTGDRNDDDALLIEIADPHPGPDAILERTQEAAQLTAAIALLPVDLRESLVLRELEELSYCEIARVTEVPIGTVVSRLHRARRQLSAMWMDDAAELTE